MLALAAVARLATVVCTRMVAAAMDMHGAAAAHIDMATGMDTLVVVATAVTMATRTAAMGTDTAPTGTAKVGVPT